MSPKMFFYAASGIAQIKKVDVQVLDRDVCSKSTFLNELILLRLRHWWLTLNHYKLAHFCLLSDLYWMELFDLSGFLSKINFSVYSQTE